MNPTATLRFRRVTGLAALAWAGFGLVVQVLALALGPPRPQLPIGPSVVGGVAMVQWRSPEAAAAGVEVGDRLLTVDGEPFVRWVRTRARDLRPDRPNRYGIRKPDGRVREVVLPPVPPGDGAGAFFRLLQLGLLGVASVYLLVGGAVWRLRPDRADSWALCLFCSMMAAELAGHAQINSSGFFSAYTLVTLPLIGATAFHLFTLHPIEPVWILRWPGVLRAVYGAAFLLAGLSLVDPALGLPAGLVPGAAFGFTALAAVAAFTSLLRERRRLGPGLLRDRADIVLFGAVVSFLPALSALAAQLLFEAAFPFYLLALGYIVFPMAVGYGIVRKELFDVRLLARSSFAYGLATVAITGLYAFLVVFAESTVSRLHVNARSPWFSVVFLFFAILAFNPLRNRLQSLVDRFFDRDRAAYRRAVREISDAIVSMLSVGEIVERMLVALTVTMGVDRALVLLLDEQGRVLRTAASRGEWEDEAARVEIPVDHPIWKQLFLRREELSRLDFDDEPDPEAREACRDVFDTLEIGLLVPILYGVDLLGVIAVGQKVTGERLSADDVQLLRTLANQSAIAIENAKAYDEIAKLNETLEARVEERTRELQEAQSQLVQSEKMASLGQLVAGVAHELNNPIGFVHANLTLLQEYLERLLGAAREGRDDPRAREAIEKLLLRSREGTERVKKIVEDLRTFSRMDRAALEEVDLHEELERTLSLMTPRLKEGISVERDYRADPRIRCHAGQLNQVFLNLLVNACDALGGRGRIRISTESDAERVFVHFEDDGPGVPEEIRTRIFDPFFTTKPVGKGTGLGLSISHGIVERHGGRISVRSRPGSTVFTLELPRSPRGGDGREAPAGPPEEAA